MTVKEIVIKYLLDNGYDGLYQNGECGCQIDDLMECGLDRVDICKPGYKKMGCSEECGRGCDYHFGEDR